MKRLCALVLCLLLLTGCGGQAVPVDAPEGETIPISTVPADGDPESIGCKGSYSGDPDAEAVVAKCGDATLTNGELAVWYWAEVNQYRQDGRETEPDWSLPLDRQDCPVAEDCASWQQYFLKQALSRWHRAQALLWHMEQTPLPLEEAYQPHEGYYETYMDGKPATAVLYGYEAYYRPNTLHQAWLDSLEETLGAESRELGDFAKALNLSYMYFTQLTYELEVEPAEDGQTVNFRHIYLASQSGETSEERETRGQELLESWQKDWRSSEATFAQLASQVSEDAGSACNGGLYRNCSREDLAEPLSDWCFAEDRQIGDTAVLLTEVGCHVVYFSGKGETQEPVAAAQRELLQQLNDQTPMTVDYAAIVLPEEGHGYSLTEVLYPDVAHERYPQVQLYLQQDYPTTMYGYYKITTNGCGITSLAMVATYLTDQEYTPPEMCARYGAYSLKTGTAGSLFEDAPPELGFYLIKKTYDWREAREYMEQGHLLVCCQHKGYWTRGGHYLVLEEMSEDGRVRVRDSNIFNYIKLKPHFSEDLFEWSTISAAGSGFWIFEKKVTTTPSCTRCGDPEALDGCFVENYLCEKCETAQLRRGCYLE